MGIEALAAVDDNDSRREVMRLLTLLDSPERNEFMQLCVTAVNSGIKTTQPPPWNLWQWWSETNEVNEVYMDLFIMISQHNLPVQAVLADLEKFVSKRKKLWKPE